MKYLGLSVVVLCVVLFTAYGFLIPQVCDIDQVYLWCRLHPISFFDLVGLVLFYAGALVLSGIPLVEKLELFNDENSSKWNVIAFAGMVLGIILIWNL